MLTALRKTLQFIGWPIAAGLVIGLGFALSQAPVRYAIGEQFALWFLPPIEKTSSYSQAVSRAAPAVVNIYTRKRIFSPRNPLFDDPLFRHFFNSSDVPQQQRMSSALGSGVVINAEGYLLTNNHVIEGADEIIIALYDGREAKAEIIGVDAETDLAVLKIPLKNLSAVTLGDPQKARVGDVVLAIGNPLSFNHTVTQGIISATGRHGLGLNVYENFIQTDAAINPGNSGGALIDSDGHLLGINTATLNSSNEGSITGVGFAIPADMAVSIMEDIIASGQAIRGWLGIQGRSLTESVLRAYNLQNNSGVFITGTYPDSPAEKAGILAGDIVTHINSQPVGNGRAGMNLIARVRPNDSVTVTLLRNGEELQLNAIAGTRPQRI